MLEKGEEEKKICSGLERYLMQSQVENHDILKIQLVYVWKSFFDLFLFNFMSPFHYLYMLYQLSRSTVTDFKISENRDHAYVAICMYTYTYM